MSAIEIKNLWKEYDDFLAIENLNLTVEKGNVFALIGPNGAGKTTLLRILSSLLPPTYGDCYINGLKVHPSNHELLSMIGFLPDFFGLYDDLKVSEYLEFFASCYNNSSSDRIKNVTDKIKEVLDVVNLSYKKEDLVGTLSRGMKQRLGIAKTILHDPEVLFLDEPASGLDPKARIELRTTIKKLRAMGKTMIISSHVLTELSDFCNSFGIMEHGKITKTEKLDSSEQIHHIIINTLSGIEIIQNILAANKQAENLQLKGDKINFDFKGTLEQVSQLHKELNNTSAQIIDFFIKKQDIEDLFLQYTSYQEE